MNVPMHSIETTKKDFTEDRSSDSHLGQNSIAGWVASQAAARPEAIAVVSSKVALTYGELDNQAQDLAKVLRDAGVGPETVVGLLLRPSPAMVVGALGILKAGGAYLPIDPTYPESRLEFLLDDAQVSVVVTDQSAHNRIPLANRKGILLDELGQLKKVESLSGHGTPNVNISPKNLAYVIYTSGSTGQPKGVEVTQAGLLNLVHWHRGAFKVTSADRASQVARVGFDAAVWEIWPYLCAGASLHSPDEAIVSDPVALQAWLVAQRITICFVPTPMAERLLGMAWPADTALRLMLTGADTLHLYAPKDIPFLLVNNYGPTECTVVTTSALVPPIGSADRLPPIGLPIANMNVHILDESRNEKAAGEQGELYIGGAGLARGYRNRPELTAEKFPPNPFSGKPGDRLFKTGDIVKRLADGQLAFFGRMDDQIKVRGFRIEPNEIAAALNEHPVILQSAVVAHEISPGDRRLVAYFVVRSDLCPTLGELREFLGARLPEYMIPASFVILENLPLTANGKVDRGALPMPDSANTLRDNVFVAPRTDVEKTVAGILAPLLGLDQVDVEDNFFSLGGHSLLGTQLIARVRDAFGVELALRNVFEAPTVAGISVEIERLLLEKLESLSEEKANSLLASTLQPYAERKVP